MNGNLKLLSEESCKSWKQSFLEVISLVNVLIEVELSVETSAYLEKGRGSLDFEIQKENYEKFQDVLIEDAPAVFLYSPDYLYLVKREIKGIENKTIVDPSKRFSGIENWYIKTKRNLF